jgi:S13-like H2TH domain
MNLPRAQQKRLGSLAHANRVRQERAQLKRDLAGGRLEVAEILNDPPPCTQSMMVRELLLALPGIGPAKADRALTHCQIASSKTVAGLSGRQQAALVTFFRR